MGIEYKVRNKQNKQKQSMKRGRAPTRERKVTTDQQSLTNSFKSMANGFMNFSSNDEFQSVLDNELVRQDSNTSFYSIEDESSNLDEIPLTNQKSEQEEHPQENKRLTQEFSQLQAKKKNSKVFEMELPAQPNLPTVEEETRVSGISDSLQKDEESFEIYSRRSREVSDYNKAYQPESVQLKIEDYQWYSSTPFKQRYQRVQLIKQFAKMMVYKKRNLINQINLNITSLIIFLLNQRMLSKVVLFLNIVLDAVFRGLYIVFIIQVSIAYPEQLIPLLFFLLVPRFLVTIIIIKLLYLDQYSVENYYIKPLSHLFRSNFTFYSSYLVDEYPPQSDNNRFIFTPRLVLYFLLPLEFSFLALITSRVPQRKQAFNTYIISLYILKGIEAICFQPLLLSFLWVNLLNLNYQQSNFERLASYLIIFDIAKYLLVNILLFIMGNASLQKKKQRKLTFQQKRLMTN